MRPYTLTDLSASEIIYLLSVNWGGTVYRFSSRPVSVSSADGDLQFMGGFDDPDISENTGITGFAVEGDSVAVQVVFPVDLALELRRGRSLDLASAEISAVMVRDGQLLQTYEERYTIFSGVITQPLIANPSEPIGTAAFSIERDTATSAKQIPAPAQVISADTFPDAHSESADGKFYPIVFGKPSSNNARQTVGTPSNRGATPGYCVYMNETQPEIRVMIAGHAVAAQSVVLRSYDGRTATLTVETATDERGLLYSYVNIFDADIGTPFSMLNKSIIDIDTDAAAGGLVTFECDTTHGFAQGSSVFIVGTNSNPVYNGEFVALATAAIDNNHFSIGSTTITTPGNQGQVGRLRDVDFYIYVEWGDSAGGLLNPFGAGALEGGGDVCRWALQASGLLVDYSSWDAIAPVLNGYVFAGCINEPVKPVEWLESEIVPYLPIDIINGGAGLRPVLSLLYQSLYLRPIVYADIETSPDFLQVGSLESITEPSNIINVIEMQYGYTVFNDAMAYSLTSDNLLQPGADNLLTSSQLQSIERFGRREATIETGYIYDSATAGRVIRDRLMVSCMPVMLCDFEAAQYFGYLQVGQVISLTAQDLHLSEALCQIVSKQWTGATWLFTLHISYDININRRTE
jgi:hypothetical protein